MSLIELKVVDLFDHFTHVIKLKNNENITILTAPNGYGKTIVLNIIDAIFNKKFRFLASLDFKVIEVKTDDCFFVIKRVSHGKNVSLYFDQADSNNSPYEYDPLKVDEEIESTHFHEIEDYIPWLDRTGLRRWHDPTTGQMLDITDVYQMYESQLPDHLTSDRYSSFPEWLLEVTSSIQIHLIQDQRLILRTNLHSSRRRGKSIIDTIEQYAHELSDEITRKSIGSSQISQKLDSSFPSRLLKKTSPFVLLSAEELKKRLSTLKLKRSMLSNHGLIASDAHSQVMTLETIENEDLRVLTLYVNDAEEKLKIYDDILSRIELFTNILNKKRLAFKSVEINGENGFRFISDRGSPLKLTQLSSGEQHEVVLLYELIFRANENVLVLIDEPEISLHIAWQKEFLTDLRDIIKLQNISAIISTHSPQIIDNNWDLVVDLAEGVKA